MIFQNKFIILKIIYACRKNHVLVTKNCHIITDLEAKNGKPMIKLIITLATSDLTTFLK